VDDFVGCLAVFSFTVFIVFGSWLGTCCNLRKVLIFGMMILNLMLCVKFVGLFHNVV